MKPFWRLINYFPYLSTGVSFKITGPFIICHSSLKLTGLSWTGLVCCALLLSSSLTRAWNLQDVIHV